jgi:hypothetical protein
MTIPLERARAIGTVRQIAEEFCGLVRLQAGAKRSDFVALAERLCGSLRHYPTNFDVREMARYAPTVVEVEGIVAQSYLDEETERNAARYLLLKRSLSSPNQREAGRSHTQMPCISVSMHPEQTYTQEGLDMTMDMLLEQMK